MVFSQVLGLVTVLVCFWLGLKSLSYGTLYWKNSLVFILLIGGLLRGFVSYELHLHRWDEQFHALVAKNMMDYPLTPTLYKKPVIEYDFKDWTHNHVWLSKQPLPFWLMAGAMKIFGVNEFSVRISSFLLALATIVLTFLIGFFLFNKKVALLAAFFHAIHGLSIELTGGKVSSDHVEVAFLFFFEMGILFSVLFMKGNKKYFLTLVGVSVGLAFLCKWIVSFFIVFIFVTVQIFREQNIRAKVIFQQALWISSIALVIILPWQIYIFGTFPRESFWMYREIFTPIKESIQGHEGGLLFYINEIRIIFGELIYFPLLWLCFIIVKKRRFKWIILGMWIFIPLILFSIAETKRYTYILISAPAFFILTAIFFYYVLSLRNKLRINNFFIISFAFLLILLPVRYCFERVKPMEEREILSRPAWQSALEELADDSLFPNDRIVIFNEPNYVQAMFYWDFIVYDRTLKKSQIDKLKREGYIVYENFNGGYYRK